MLYINPNQKHFLIKIQTLTMSNPTTSKESQALVNPPSTPKEGSGLAYIFNLMAKFLSLISDKKYKDAEQLIKQSRLSQKSTLKVQINNFLPKIYSQYRQLEEMKETLKEPQKKMKVYRDIMQNLQHPMFLKKIINDNSNSFLIPPTIKSIMSQQIYLIQQFAQTKKKLQQYKDLYQDKKLSLQNADLLKKIQSNSKPNKKIEQPKQEKLKSSQSQQQLLTPKMNSSAKPQGLSKFSEANQNNFNSLPGSPNKPSINPQIKSLENLFKPIQIEKKAQQSKTQQVKPKKQEEKKSQGSKTQRPSVESKGQNNLSNSMKKIQTKPEAKEFEMRSANKTLPTIYEKSEEKNPQTKKQGNEEKPKANSNKTQQVKKVISSNQTKIQPSISMKKTEQSSTTTLSTKIDTQLLPENGNKKHQVHQKVIQVLKESQIQIHKLNVAINEQKRTISILEQTKRQNDLLIKKLRNQANNLNEECKKITQRLLITQSELNAKNSQISHLSKKLQSLEKIEQTNQGLTNQIQVVKNDHFKDVQKLKNRAALLQSSQAKLKQSYIKLQQDSDRLKNTIKEKVAIISQSEKEMKEKADQIVSLKNTNEDLKNQVKHLQVEHDRRPNFMQMSFRTEDYSRNNCSREKYQQLKRIYQIKVSQLKQRLATSEKAKQQLEEISLKQLQNMDSYHQPLNHEQVKSYQQKIKNLEEELKLLDLRHKQTVDKRSKDYEAKIIELQKQYFSMKNKYEQRQAELNKIVENLEVSSKIQKEEAQKVQQSYYEQIQKIQQEGAKRQQQTIKNMRLLEKRSEKIEKQLSEMTSQLYAQKTQKDRLKTDCSRLTKQIQGLKDENTKIIDQIKAMENRTAQKQAKVKTLSAQITALNRKLAQSQQASTECKKQSLTQKLQIIELETTLKKKCEYIQGMNKEEEKIKGEVKETESEVKETKREQKGGQEMKEHQNVVIVRKGRISEIKESESSNSEEGNRKRKNSQPSSSWSEFAPPTKN